MKDVEVKSLKGKTILVTGSGKGLGSAIAVEAARQGAKVAVHYRSSEKNAYQVFEEVRAFGQDCTLIRPICPARRKPSACTRRRSGHWGKLIFW